MENINLVETLKVQKENFIKEIEETNEKIKALEKVINIFGNGVPTTIIAETVTPSHKWTKEIMHLFEQTTKPMEIQDVYKSFTKKGLSIEMKEKRSIYSTLNRLANAGRLFKNAKGMFKQAKGKI